MPSTLLPNTYQAIKAVKRNNPRAEKMNLLRRRNLPTSPHTPLTDKLGSLEQKIRKEIAIMKKCRHGHIVRLLEVIDDKLNDRIYMGKHLPAANPANFPPYLLPDSAPWASISIEE
jgi:serine/threonine protein kinase